VETEILSLLELNPKGAEILGLIHVHLKPREKEEAKESSGHYYAFMGNV